VVIGSSSVVVRDVKGGADDLGIRAGRADFCTACRGASGGLAAADGLSGGRESPFAMP
jgi:hypothetical protein